MRHTPPFRTPAPAVLRAAIIFCLLPAAARAASPTVDCTAVNPPPGVFNTVNAALATLDQMGPHTVTVTGPCTEAVNLQQRDRLTIQSAPAHTAVINAPGSGLNVMIVGGSRDVVLRGLELRGGANGLLITRGSSVNVQGITIKGSAGNGLRVDTGSVVNLNGLPPFAPLVVSGNEGAGISADAAVLSVAGGLTVEDNLGPAMSVTGGRLVVNGGQAPNVFRHNGGGLNLDAAVSNFNGENTIQNNGGSGVQVTAGRAGFGGSIVAGVPRATTIEGHVLGVNIAAGGAVNFGGPNRVRNNGAGDPEAQFRGGIRVGTSSRLQFDGGEVTGNTGYGIFLDFNGTLALSGSTISNNTTGGVRVARSSAGGFNDGNTFAGSGGPHISCDDTSLVHGTGLTGFGKGIDCKNIEHEKGPSRPSVPKEHD